MSLEEVLKKAVERINSGSLTNEAQVKQSVIVPILRALDWDDSEPAEFVPEFSVESGRVDYALLRNGGPLVFIEAKGLGGVDIKGEEQVFRYAVNRGVPFLILTDGNLWDFYLSMAAGDPPDRQFYRVELTNEERIHEYVESLEMYLRKNRVVSEDARVDAEQRHKTNRESGEARKAIPGVWRNLLETPDDMLRDLLAEEVARACGTRPRLEDVEAFLKGLSSEVVPPSPRPRSSKSVPASMASHRRAAESDSASAQPKTNRYKIIVGFVLDGKHGGTETSIGNLAAILKEFSVRESGFMHHFKEKTQGTKRPLVSKDRDELYARPDEDRPQAEDLENGWWLQKGIRATTKEIKEHIEIACEVAGVKFGTQLKLIER